MISMNKGTHFLGQPMYGQLISLLDKAQILRISQENGGERYVKHFVAWQHLVCSMQWSNVSTPCEKSWHLCCLKPVNWDIWALTPCRVAPHSRMPTCAVTNVSSKLPTESCTPLISTCFPRAVDGAVVQSGSNACKSSIRRTYLSSPISYSKVSGGIRRPGKRRAASKFTPILCQRVCALRHSFHLGGQGGFLHVPPL